MKIILSICFTVFLIGALAGIKVLQFKQMGAEDAAAQPPVLAISTFVAEERMWENNIPSIASLEAVQGVTVSAEVPGRVEQILFRAGQEVNAGDLLLELSAASELAELKALQANVDLAKLDIDRAKDLLKSQTISQAEFDRANATFKQQEAQLETIKAQIDKKRIIAPFDGELGIRQINLGEVLSAGAPIVTLQNKDKLFVNFSLPQRVVSQVEIGSKVRVIDPNNGYTAIARLTTINPQINVLNRNISLQAELDNESGQWVPGMYVEAELILPKQSSYVVVPSTAVIYSSYGSTVYVIEENEDGQKVSVGQLVRTGTTRGDFVAITEGLSAGQEVATSGAFKLRNNALVSVKNERTPNFSETPDLRDE